MNRNILSTAKTVGTIGLASLVGPGCDREQARNIDNHSTTPISKMSPAWRDATRSERLSQITDFGNGVLVFPANNDFPITLSDFRGVHPELRIVSVTQGTDNLHYVIQGTDNLNYYGASLGKDKSYQYAGYQTGSSDFVVVTEKLEVTGDKLRR
jgi:hypothetical protein